jgi:hypothetical protein
MNNHAELMRLLSEEQSLADELLALSTEEKQCCELDQSERLIDIGIQRKEVLNTWLMTRDRTVAASKASGKRDQSTQRKVEDIMFRLDQTIAAINANDQISLKLLNEKSNRCLSRMRNVNQGARLLRSFSVPTSPLAHDSRG